MKLLPFLIVAGAAVSHPVARGAISLQYGISHGQNFDSLAASGTGSALPAGWAAAEVGPGANSSYQTGNGSSGAGDTYSFGAAGSTDRALGSVRDGNVITTFGAQFQNQTGVAIDRLGVIYYGEEWRLGTPGRKDKLDFQYSLDATSLTTGTWQDANQLDFLSPNTVGAAGAKDGNQLGLNRRPIGSQISFISIPQGADFWIRWVDFDASGADDGLAVDDFSITAVPETNTILIAVASLGVLGWSIGREQFRKFRNLPAQ